MSEPCQIAGGGDVDLHPFMFDSLENQAYKHSYGPRQHGVCRASIASRHGRPSLDSQRIRRSPENPGRGDRELQDVCTRRSNL